MFRVDDFRLEYNDLQEKIIDVFTRNNIPLVIGVIPTKNHALYDSIPDAIIPKWVELVNNNNIEIALHGFYHESSIVGEKGEFTKALSLDEQFSRIKKGKYFLDSVFRANGAMKDIHTFIPPWNIFDNNTLYALERLHFDVISASRTSALFYDTNRIKYYPCTAEEFDKVKNFNQSGEGTFIILFHPYTFENYSLEELDKLLQVLSKSPDNKFYTIRDLETHGVRPYDGGYVGKIQFLMKKVFKNYYALNGYEKREINLKNSIIIAIGICLIVLIGYGWNKRLPFICAVFFFSTFMLSFLLSGSGYITDKYLVAIFVTIAVLAILWKHVYSYSRTC